MASQTSVPATVEQFSGPVVVMNEADKFSLMQRKAALFARSPLIPDHLRKGSADEALANCYIGLVLAEQMGENPLIILQNIHIVKGKAGFSAQYMIARANASGMFRDPIDWEIEGKGDSLSVTAFATVATTGRRISVNVDMAMAKAEGWTQNSKYKSMPELMLRYRSATFLVRLYAPHVMLGYHTVEELEDLSVAGPDLHAKPLTAAALIAQGEAEAVAHDAATGEIIETTATPSQSSESSPATGGSQPSSAETEAADDNKAVSEGAVQAEADADQWESWLDKARQNFMAAETVPDLNSYWSDLKDELRAAPAEFATAAEASFTTRLKALKEAK